MLGVYPPCSFRLLPQWENRQTVSIKFTGFLRGNQRNFRCEQGVGPYSGGSGCKRLDHDQIGGQMNIYEALKSRTADKPFITRETWMQDCRPLGIYRVKILATNSPDCCLIQSRFRQREPTPRWNPTGADLQAEDWIITD